MGKQERPKKFPNSVKFLTDPNDLVVDPFGGSNSTGGAAERLERYWITFELVPEYLEGSKFRFHDVLETQTLWTGILFEQQAEYTVDPNLELIDATEELTEEVTLEDGQGEDVAGKQDIASLHGAAGSLDKPLTWQQMQEIAYEDRLKENYDTE